MKFQGLRRGGVGRRPARSRMMNRPGLEALEARALMSYGGSPDLTFGQAGIVTGSFLGGGFTASVEAIQADGKIVVAGTSASTLSSAGSHSLELIRLNADGSLDTSFGDSGAVGLFSTLIANGEPVTASAVAIQPDGKIVVAGQANGGPFVARLLTDGTPDGSFGSRPGVTAINPGVVVPSDPQATGASVAALALQPDGKIVVTGSGANLGGTSGPAVDSVVAFVDRLDANGLPDTSFGTAGVVPLAFTPPSNTTLAKSLPVGVVIQADGSIVVAGNVEGSQISAGSTIVTPEVALARFTPLGVLDPTFGSGGKVTLAIGSENLDYSQTLPAESLTIQPDGKLIVAGTDIGITAVVPPGGHDPIPLYQDQVLVLRIDSDGTLDQGFGRGGIVEGPGGQRIDSTSPIEINAAIQPDGKIVVAGGVAFRNVPNQGTASGNQMVFTGTSLIRLEPDGSPDPGFGPGGGAPVQNDLGSAVAIALRPDGKIVLLGSGAEPSEVAQFLPEGAPDDFNNDGVSDPALFIPSTATFVYRPSGGGPGSDVIEGFGAAGAGQTLPAPGSYDGQGVTELGVYLTSIGAFAYRPFTLDPETHQPEPDRIIPFGVAGVGNSIPAPADYDGSGQTDLAVYLPSIGSFAYRPSNGGPDAFVPFGFAGPGQTIPVPADYFGTGRDDIAAYLPAIGTFALRNPNGGPDVIEPFGIPGMGNSIPVPGDYDGSGHVSLAVYLPSIGVYAIRPSNGGPDVIEPFGIPGAGNSIPVPGDYDGSGRTELAVYLPKQGVFAYRPADGGPDVIEPFGVAGIDYSIPFLANQQPIAPASPAGAATVSAAAVEYPLPLDDASAIVAPRKAKATPLA